MVTGSSPIRLLAIAVFVLAMLLPAASAGAHAILEQTSPARGVTVDSQPKLVEFRFSEPVEGSFGAVRVFNAHGDRVDDDDIVRPNGDETVGVGSKAGCPTGPTPRPTASSPPTATRSPAASCSRSAKARRAPARRSPS